MRSEAEIRELREAIKRDLSRQVGEFFRSHGRLPEAQREMPAAFVQGMNTVRVLEWVLGEFSTGAQDQSPEDFWRKQLDGFGL